MTAPVRVGTSGWSYPEWRHDFYAGVPQRLWLEHAAGTFTGLEVNATFYRFFKAETYARWHQRTPAGFAFAIKGHRLITHQRRLRNIAKPVADMWRGARGLGDKLQAVLWQLPADLQQDLALLHNFADALRSWPEVRHVMEFRHPSWFVDETAAVLADSGLGNCLSDSPAWPAWDRPTAGLAYVRLHGHRELYVSKYGKKGLAPWARRVRRWAEDGLVVHVYFDNTAAGAAHRDAVMLLTMLGGNDAKAK